MPRAASTSPESPSCSRRTMLKTALAGSAALAATEGLPARWVRPVIDSVILPAHAQASIPPVAQAAIGPFSTAGFVLASVAEPQRLAEHRNDTDSTSRHRWWEWLMPAVHAQSVACFGDCAFDLEVSVNETSMTLCGVMSGAANAPGGVPVTVSETVPVDLQANPPTASGPILLTTVVFERAQFANGAWTLEFRDQPGGISRVLLSPGGSGCTVAPTPPNG